MGSRRIRKMEYWEKKENLIRVQGWARDGLTMIQIAKNMGIGKNTLYKWLRNSDDIENAVIIGRDTADRQVENALFKNAIGFYFKEEQLTDDGRKVEVRKYFRPNTGAQIHWLKNRKPNEWRDKKDITHGGNINQNINMQGLSEDELRNLANMAIDDDE